MSVFGIGTLPMLLALGLVADRLLSLIRRPCIRQIAEVARTSGADVPFLRPKELATDSATDIQFLRHAVGWLKDHRGWEPTIVVTLQPTCPFRTSSDIDNVIRIIQRPGVDSVRTIVNASPNNPYKMWKHVGNDGEIEPIIRTNHFDRIGTDIPRQSLPDYYLQVGVVYGTKTEFIKQDRILGDKVIGYEIPANRFIDIDVPEDLVRANELLAALKQ